MLTRMHKICGISYFSIELKRGSSKTTGFSFNKKACCVFNCYNLQYLLATILSLDNVGAFFFLTMTRKPTRLTCINNATINRHDVLYPSEQSFATVHRVRLDLACHAFSTDVKGFLLQNFQPRQCSLSRYRGFDSRGRTNTQGLKITEK